MCGEYCKQHVGQLKMLGSSPLVRGIHLLNFRTKNLKRIIPACAGNTSKGKKQCYIQRDHPRLCGEYFNRAFQNVNVQGSSPLVRGIHGYIPDDVRSVRIIPACAGNTDFKFYVTKPMRDHPRLCGEYCKLLLQALKKLGSSPLVRGIHSKKLDFP